MMSKNGSVASLGALCPKFFWFKTTISPQHFAVSDKLGCIVTSDKLGCIVTSDKLGCIATRDKLGCIVTFDLSHLETQLFSSIINCSFVQCQLKQSTSYLYKL